jgi:O6-methylguanine-DNA--protein-cysteine methyltransferase
VDRDRYRREVKAMTLDEAIKHCGKEVKRIERNHPYIDTTGYKQLAEWLRELKAYRGIRHILSQNRIATDRYGDVVLWDDIKRVFKEVKADDE